MTDAPTIREYFGKYIGTVKAEWLEDGRLMKLLEQFSFEDPQGIQWSAPPGSLVDGASIPSFAWSIIGSPFTGRYRDASVIHDVACQEKRRDWEAVHLAFYFAMRTSRVNNLQAKIMYAAVYHFGPRWLLKPVEREATKRDEPWESGDMAPPSTPADKEAPQRITSAEEAFKKMADTIASAEETGRAMSLDDIRTYPSGY